MTETALATREATQPASGQATALVPATDFGALIPTEQELLVYEHMAKRAANTPFYTKLGGEAGIVSIMLYARELGISPMTAISGGLHNIQGRIELSARIINFKIRQAGHQLKVLEHTDKICRIAGKRKDTGEEQESSFTLEEAMLAQLVKKDSNWDKFPKDMLFARAISRLGRWLFPDVIGSAYVEGEVSDNPDFYDDRPIDVTPEKTTGRGRPRKTQTPVPPTESSAPAAEETAKAPDTAEPAQEAPTEDSQAPAEVNSTQDTPTEVLTSTTTEAEKLASEPHPEIAKFVGTVLSYLRTSRKMGDGKIAEAEKLICDEFWVDDPKGVPFEKFDALQAFCRGKLLAELTQGA